MHRIVIALVLATFLTFPAIKFQFFVGGWGIVGYWLLATALLLVLPWCESRFQKLVPSKYDAYLVSGFLVVLLVIFQSAYPYLNQYQGGSDRDEALDIATTELASGRYPYYAKAQVSWLPVDVAEERATPISPLPGELFFAVPFLVVFGSAVYQTFFWLLLFYAFVRKYSREHSLVFWFMLFLTPITWHEVLTGGDYLANALWVTILSLLSLSAIQRHSSSRLKWLYLILFGIGLSSRANVLLVLPAFFAVLTYSEKWLKALGYFLVPVGTCLLVTVPFYLYDPLHFSPLHTYNKLASLDAVMPHLGVITIIASLIFSASLFLWKKRDTRTFMMVAALAMFIPVVVTCLVQAYVQQSLNVGEYSWYALMSLPYALLWLFPQLYQPSKD